LSEHFFFYWFYNYILFIVGIFSCVLFYSMCT